MTLQLEEPVRGNRPPAPMLVQTKVVRCEPDGLGVQFLDLSKLERQRLMDLLKSIP
jgi:PilZ domain